MILLLLLSLSTLTQGISLSADLRASLCAYLPARMCANTLRGVASVFPDDPSLSVSELKQISAGCWTEFSGLL